MAHAMSPIGGVGINPQELAARGPARLFRQFPILQALPARVIGVGLRPEHAPVAKS